MRHIARFNAVVLVAFVLVSCSSDPRASEGSAAKPKVNTVSVAGLELKIGMSKADAINAFASSQLVHVRRCFGSRPSSSCQIATSDAAGSARDIGTLHFTDDALVQVILNVRDFDSKEAQQAFLLLWQMLKETKNKTCTVETEHDDHPVSLS